MRALAARMLVTHYARPPLPPGASPPVVSGVRDRAPGAGHSDPRKLLRAGASAYLIAAEADVCLYRAVNCLTYLALLNAIAPVPKMGAFETVVREAEGGAELMSHQEVFVQQRLEKKRRGGTVGFSERSH